MTPVEHPPTDQEIELIMGFTVTKDIGTRDAEFEAYARLLRQRGKNLGNLPRVPDPENPKRRWVFVWNSKEEAQEFADELREQSGASGWRVEATAAPPSDGPFGPVLIQLTRRSDGLVMALHPLSRAMIRDTYPDARPGASSTFINAETWSNFLKTHGTMKDLVEEIAPPLTGLKLDRLRKLGYALIDVETDETWDYLAPEGVAQNQA